ncbi:MAG: hypothetical protein V1744_01665 [Candidatus Altiarchaeota archaeon]
MGFSGGPWDVVAGITAVAITAKGVEKITGGLDGDSSDDGESASEE